MQAYVVLAGNLCGAGQMTVLLRPLALRKKVRHISDITQFNESDGLRGCDGEI